MAEKMLNEDIQRQISDIFTELQEPVEVLFFGSQSTNCEYCGETQQLLEEVIALSERLSLTVKDFDQDSDLAKQYRVEAVPTFVILGKDGTQLLDYGIRFMGIPAGHEFTSLINDLLMVSKRESNLSPETRAYLATLKKPVHLQVFVTPT